MTPIARREAGASTSRWLVSPYFWLWLVALAYLALQLVLTSESRFLAWDEAVYVSEVSGFAHPVGLAAHRARGITLLVAPVALWTESMTAMRVYLAVLSSFALALSCAAWVKVIGWAAPVAAAVFASNWLALYYGSEVMPNLWSAFFVVAMVGLALGLLKDPTSWSGRYLLVGAGAGLAILRPLDAAVTFLILGLIWLTTRQRQALKAFWLGSVGIAIGATAWLVESYARFDGPLERLERARSVVGGGLNNNVVEYLRLLDGPTSGPDRVTTISLAGVSWLTVVMLLAVAGSVVGTRFRSASVVALVGAALLAAPYLFLSEAVAPRFMLPAVGLLSLAAGSGALAMIDRLALVARISLTVALIVGLVLLSIGTVRAIDAEQSAARGRVLQLAQAVAVEANDQPCFFHSTSGFPQISFASGCEGGRYSGAGSHEKLNEASHDGLATVVLVNSEEHIGLVTEAGAQCEPVSGLEARNWQICQWQPGG